jgi:hypothetical protein
VAHGLHAFAGGLAYGSEDCVPEAGDDCCWSEATLVFCGLTGLLWTSMLGR